MRDLDAYPPEERLAREKGVTYVKLDGEVGILGNGAGLVMSTLDVIAQAGGRAANFCDIGGGGGAHVVVDALEVITADPQVRSILFNVFGGITRTDEVAQGILEALERIDIQHPIVVRLDGTNADEGRRLLADAAPANVHVEETMLAAAQRCGRAREGGGVVAIVVDQRDAPRRPGRHRPGGLVPRDSEPRYGTNVVAGVTPGKGGESVEGIPVFDTVRDAVDETQANTAMVFVPARFAADAIYEAVDAGIETVICVTEGIPAHDMLRVYNYVRPRGVTLVGPNCPGVLSPGKANVGIIPAEIFSEGARRPRLPLRDAHVPDRARADTARHRPVHDRGHRRRPRRRARRSSTSSTRFEADPETEIVVMVGEIGGAEEEKAAAFIGEHMTKPVVAYIAGFTAPPGKTMGHAGAIISGIVRHGAGEEGSARGPGRPRRHEPDRGRAARRRGRRGRRLREGRPGAHAERPGSEVVYGVRVLEKMLDGPPPRVDPQAVANLLPKSSPM